MSPTRPHLPRAGLPRAGLPRAGIDPIEGAGPALRMLRLLIDEPRRPQTVALLLDAHRRGLGALVVDGTRHPDSVLDIARVLAEAAAHHPLLRSVAIASVRRGPQPPDTMLDDVDRWADLDDILGEAAIELLEWFVVSDADAVSCPRDLLGAPARW